VNKVIVSLKGGLGNQMFQYATGKAIASRNCQELFLDKSHLERDNLREYSLGCFSIEEKFVDERTLEKVHPKGSYRKKFKALQNKILPWYRRSIIREDCPDFEIEDFDQIKGNVYLDGYWQSEMFFQDFAEDIRQDFTFKDNPNEINKKFIDRIRKENSVSIHIRRQDYVSNKKTLKKHGILDLSYYARAVEILTKDFLSPVLFVFSDDIDWAKKNLKLKHKTIYVDHNREKSPEEDLRLMIECKKHVIANSTFSWWGAWLSKSSQKEVIAPKNWFTKGEMLQRDKFDIIPKKWDKI